MHTRYCVRCPKEVNIVPPTSTPLRPLDQGEYLKAIAEARCPGCGGPLVTGPKMVELAKQWLTERDSASKHAEEHRRQRDEVIRVVAEAVGEKWNGGETWAHIYGRLTRELAELREWKVTVARALGWSPGTPMITARGAAGRAREAVRGLESLREHIAVVTKTGAPGKALQSALSRSNERVVSLEEQLARSLHVENTGEGWKLLLGSGEVILEWLGDGISADRVLHRKPHLTYMVDTTPHVRCLRMLVEWWNWPIACALVTGIAGHGELRPSHELNEDQCVEGLGALREAARDVVDLCTNGDEQLAEAVALLEATIRQWKEDEDVAGEG